MKKIISSIKNALSGLKYAYHRDKSFRMEVWGSLGFVTIAWLLFPLSGIEFLFLILSYFLILITELINTSIEQLLERLHPEKHTLIGKGKDIASASVLVAFVFAVIVIAVMIQSRFK